MGKSKLLEPITIGKLSLKNRVVMPPMCMYEVEKEDGIVTEFHKIHYGARAIGGVGLIIIEATAIEPRGRLTMNDLGLWNDSQVEKFTDLVALLHKFGSKVGVQLAHGGRKAITNEEPIAPSALRFNENYAIPKAMTIAEIQAIVQQFQAAAKRASDANVDMIEIHVAHGYLLNEFISPLTNKRDDMYGGSLENRYRIVKEVIEAVKTVFDKSIWVRISANEYAENGTTMDEFVQIVSYMKEQGVELVDVSSGGVIDNPPRNLYPGYQVERATFIKEQTGMPVSVVGFLTDPKVGEFILRTNQADLIAVGRGLIANPNWILIAAEALREQDNFKMYNNSYERGRNR